MFLVAHWAKTRSGFSLPFFYSYLSVCSQEYICRVHKPEVPHGPASHQRFGPADNIVNDAQLLAQPKYLNDWPKGQSNLRPEGLAKAEQTLASDFGPPLRPEGLAKEEQRSLPPPDGLSDWKA